MNPPDPSIRHELEQIYLRGAARAPVAIMIMLAALITFTHPPVPMRELIAWVGPLVALFLLRWRLAARVIAQPGSSLEPWVAQAMPWLVGVIGVIAGAFCLALFPRLPLERQALVSLVYIGWIAGAVGTNYPVPSWVAAFSVPLVLGLIGGWFRSSHGVLDAEIAGLLALFALMLYLSARDAYGVLVESIRQRFANQALIASLETRGRELQSALKSKSRFLAAASHDLRQPLASLSLYAASMQAVNDIDDLRRLASKLQAPVDALEAVLASILELSQLEAGVIVPRLQAVEVAPLLAGLADEYEAQAQSKGLGFKLGSRPARLQTDPALLARVLRNLLTNAIKFTPAGSVSLHFWLENDRARFEVSDTGIGIAHSWLDQVFDEYSQVANPQRDRNLGMGLGLSIVRRVAGLLGASVSVESKEGQGSTFRVDFPLASLLPLADPPPAATGSSVIDAVTASTAAASSPSSATPDSAGTATAPPPIVAGETATAPSAAITPSPLPELTGSRVLIVEDDALVADAMTQVFSSRGAQVSTAANVDDLQALFNRDVNMTFEYAVVDHRLPQGQRGLDVIETLERRMPLIRCVLVTGDFDEDLLRRAECQSVTVLHKPVNPERLLQTLVEQAAPG